VAGRAAVRRPPATKLAGLALAAALAVAGFYAPARAQGAGAPALERFLEASGGLARIRALESVAFTATGEAYGRSSAMELLADGRMRIESTDGAVVFDGTRYWRTFHGLVQPLTEEQSEPYRDQGLWPFLFHGLLQPGGEPAGGEPAGRETSRGRVHERLIVRAPDGATRTYYFDVETGLLDRMVELLPDPDLRERKNVYTFGEYEEIGGLRLPTRLQGQCVTNNLEIMPLTRLSDLHVDPPLDRGRFDRPAATAPAAVLDGEALDGVVLGLSGGGSLITNITAEDLGRIEAAEGAVLLASVKGRDLEFPFRAAIEDFSAVGRGDYLATFNGTPALWLVKAYVGMRSDDSTYAAGDRVRVTVRRARDAEAQVGTEPQTQAEVQAETEEEARTAAEVEERAASQADAQTEAQAEAQGEAGATAQTEARGEAQASARAEARGEAQTEAHVRRYCTLGRTGLRVSDIGFGAGSTTDPALIEYALDLGINYFDTAENYAGGQSESAVGQVAARRRDEMVLCTKLGLDAASTRESIFARLDACLERLQTDHVDILMIHGGDLGALANPEVYEAFDSLKARGKIRFSGVSHHGPNISTELRPVVEEGRLDVILCSYDPLGDPGLPDFLEAARRKGIGLVAMKVFASARAEALPEFASGDQPFHLAALRWGLKNSGMHTVLVSMNMMDQVDEYIQVSGAALP